MNALPVRAARPEDNAWICQFLRQYWNDTIVAVHGDAIDAAVLPALIAGDCRGLATYRLLGREAELVTLNAEPKNAGTGTALLEALSRRLTDLGSERLWLTTTNDHLAALRFYQRRGFRLVQVRPNAVAEARRHKPSIPTNGDYGIPVCDELDLCRILDRRSTECGTGLPPWSHTQAPAHGGAA